MDSKDDKIRELNELCDHYRDFIDEYVGRMGGVVFCDLCLHAFGGWDEVTEVDDGGEKYCEDCLDGVQSTGEVHKCDCENCDEYFSRGNYYSKEGDLEFCSEGCQEDYVECQKQMKED